MEPFLVAIVVIVGGGFLFRYLRARTAHSHERPASATPTRWGRPV
jgi:hypothetical protein